MEDLLDLKRGPFDLQNRERAGAALGRIGRVGEKVRRRSALAGGVKQAVRAAAEIIDIKSRLDDAVLAGLVERWAYQRLVAPAGDEALLSIAARCDPVIGGDRRSAGDHRSALARSPQEHTARRLIGGQLLDGMRSSASMKLLAAKPPPGSVATPLLDRGIDDATDPGWRRRRLARERTDLDRFAFAAPAPHRSEGRGRAPRIGSRRPSPDSRGRSSCLVDRRHGPETSPSRDGRGR